MCVFFGWISRNDTSFLDIFGASGVKDEHLGNSYHEIHFRGKRICSYHGDGKLFPLEKFQVGTILEGKFTPWRCIHSLEATSQKSKSSLWMAVFSRLGSGFPVDSISIMLAPLEHDNQSHYIIDVHKTWRDKHKEGKSQRTRFVVWVHASLFEMKLVFYWKIVFHIELLI